MSTDKITGLHSLTGSIKPKEPKLPDEGADDKNTIKLVFGTSGEYPDGTKWERDATPEEQAEYESWC